MVVVLKGYPRLSETFIAQELLGLQKAGFDLSLVALRRPDEILRHPVHDEIKAPIVYLPEYLHQEPLRVLRALARCLGRPGLLAALATFVSDLVHEPTRNRVRRLGQALVLSAEWPDGATWLYAHFIHTPATVTHYASLVMMVPWTCSAHAKDIWTTPGKELSRKLVAARWTVACTQAGFEHLSSLAPAGSRVHLVHHGIDLCRFPEFAGTRPGRNGSDPADPVIILSVGRAVPKKGFDILLTALSRIAGDFSFKLVHVGGGDQLGSLQALARQLGLGSRIEWRGPLAQQAILELYRSADLFALACRITEDGDRDGLPNVIVEAASQRLACAATDLAGISELISDNVNGLLVRPDDVAAFASALARLIGDPSLRSRLGDEAGRTVRAHYDHRDSVNKIVSLFDSEWRLVS